MALLHQRLDHRRLSPGSRSPRALVDAHLVSTTRAALAWSSPESSRVRPYHESPEFPEEPPANRADDRRYSPTPAPGHSPPRMPERGFAVALAQRGHPGSERGDALSRMTTADVTMHPSTTPVTPCPGASLTSRATASGIPPGHSLIDHGGARSDRALFDGAGQPEDRLYSEFADRTDLAHAGFPIVSVPVLSSMATSTPASCFQPMP
jgi:hypothetical protein